MSEVFDYNRDSPPYYWDRSPVANYAPLPEVSDAVSQYLSGLSSASSAELISALSTSPSPLIWTEVLTPVSIGNTPPPALALFPPSTPPPSRTSKPPVTPFEILATTVAAASPLAPQALGFPVSPSLQYSDPATPANLPVTTEEGPSTPVYDYSTPLYSPIAVDPATESDWFPDGDRSPSPINYNRVAEGVEALPDSELDIPAPRETAAEAYARLRPPTPAHPVLSLTPVPSPRPLPPLPHLDDQENTPPAITFPEPPCYHEGEEHPHQYIAVQTLRHSEIRPWNEVTNGSLLDVPPVAALIEHPPLFPGVQPFCVPPLHILRVSPFNRQLARYLQIPVFYACCRAIRVPPKEDLPFGLIRYSFEQSLATIFNNYDDATKAAFIGTLVLFESIDFLDGRILNTYGYLNFGPSNTYFLQDPGYHCEDLIRHHPGLLRYCLTPRLPVDPFVYATVTPVGNRPLSAT